MSEQTIRREIKNDINKEVLSYSYSQDKNGIIVDEPEKFNDHCLDASGQIFYLSNYIFSPSLF